MEIKELAKKIFSCINPAEYDTFVQNTFKYVLVNFLTALLVFVVLMALLNVPRAATYPKEFSSEFSKFTKFKVDVNATAKEPVDLWLLKIDTNNNTELKREGVMFSKDYLQMKYLSFLPPIKENLTEYKDFVSSSAKVRAKLIMLGILLIPSVLFANYLYFFAKFALVILITALLGFIISRIAKRETEFLAALKACIFASPILMFEILLRVFDFGIWVEQAVPLAVFLFFAAIGIYRSSGRVSGMGFKKHKKGGFEGKRHSDDDDF